MVHEVKPGQVVYPNEEGGNIVAEQLVLTPGGFRSQSLVHFIEPGHGLIVDQGVLKKIEMASRRIIDLPPPLQGAIAPPMDRAKARPAGEPAVVPAFGTGWITYAWWDSGATPITSFSTKLGSAAGPSDQ
jgi:hypothetical protein